MSLYDARIIVCATDLSDGAGEALDTALELPPGAAKRTIHVLHVHQAVDRIDSVDVATKRVEEEEEAVRAHVRREIERVTALRGAAPDVDVVTEVRYGNAAQEIVGFAVDLKADAVVIGTHGRTGIRRALFGSVAEHVVRRAPCIVIVAKTADVRRHLIELASHD